jgi:ABC-2 type transport system permease protein
VSRADQPRELAGAHPADRGAPRARPGLWRPVYAVVERDLVKLWRQKGRLLSALVRPLIWLFVIGAGFEATVGGSGGSYRSFLVPGVMGMAILFGALLGALSTVYEKESGVMRMLVIAPFAHRWIVFAKMQAAAVSAVFQALLLLVILAGLGDLPADTDWALLVLGIFATAYACAGIGMLVAAFSKTLDNFAAIMNFVIFPVFFLSGSLYPVSNLSGPLGVAAHLNPYTYGVDLLKHALPQVSGHAADFAVTLDVAVLAGFAVLAFAVSAWRFSREQAYAPLFGFGGPKKGGPGAGKPGGGKTA